MVNKLVNVLFKFVFVSAMCVPAVKPALSQPVTGPAIPNVTLKSKIVISGRKALRYEHQNLPEWGYKNRQSDYFYVVPAVVDTEGKIPLRVILHNAGNDALMAVKLGLKKKEELLHYYGNERYCLLYLDCRGNKDNDWWWGYWNIRDSGDDYKTKFCPTEKRVFSTIEWVVRKYNIDRNRIYLSGMSMGGSGSLGIGMIRGDLFAAVNVIVPAGVDHVFYRMKNGIYPDPPPMIDFSSQNDDWSKGQEKLMSYLEKNKYSYVFTWGPYGHAGSGNTFKTIVIDYPWLKIKKNEAYPVFTDVSVKNKYPGWENTTNPDQRGQINGYFRWHNIEDGENNFKIELRLVTKKELTMPDNLPVMIEADVSLRRLQEFRVSRTTNYLWYFLRGTDTLYSGIVVPDSRNIITIHGLKIERQPAVLMLKPKTTAIRLNKNQRENKVLFEAINSGSIIKFNVDKSIKLMSIFDIYGKKIRNLKINDGTAVWNGKNSQGKKFPSGVYLGRAANLEKKILFTLY